MNKIKEKLGKKSLIEKKQEWGEHFRKKFPVPKKAAKHEENEPTYQGISVHLDDTSVAGNFVRKGSWYLWYPFGSVVQMHWTFLAGRYVFFMLGGFF
jgi:hypothetical protein